MSLKIYYDGGCYFCQRYADLVKLRSVAGGVELISLRDGSPEAVAVIEAGHAVNTGFVVEHQGRILKGAQAFAYLNGMLDRADWLSRIMARTGGNLLIARVLYPVLVILRMVFLALQGRALIDRDNPLNNRSVLDESPGVRAFRLAPLAVAVVGVTGAVIGPNLAGARVSDLHLLRMLALATMGLACFVPIYLRQDLAIRLYSRLRYGGWWPLVAYLGVWLAIVHVPEILVLRRFVALAAGFPLLGILLDLWREKRRDARYPRAVAAYPLFLGLFVLIPGWFFPPFFGGISGWTSPVDRTRPVVLSGAKLVNRDGGETWHNHAFFQPHTQRERFERAFLGKTDSMQAYLEFVFQNYERIYPGLQQGHLPHQWALGPLAYPTHNLSDNNASEYVPDFAPENITAMRYVREGYAWDGSLATREVLYELPLNSGVE